MHYFVDGYNLLFRYSLSESDLKKQRSRVISYLSGKAKQLGLHLTLVFDSQHQQDEESHSHYKGMEICFTALNETADEFILRKIRGLKTPRQHTVVTSDRQLALFCRHEHAHTMTIEDFVQVLERVRNRPQRRPESESESHTAALRPLIPPKTKVKSIQQTDVDILKDPKASFADCFESYLETFEKQVAEQMVEETKKRPTQHPLKVKKTVREKPTQDPLESDMQRWLRLFENKE